MTESDHPSTFSSKPEDGRYFESNSSTSMSTIATRIETVLRHRVLSHFCYWVVILIVLAYHGSLFGGTFQNNLINMSVMMPVQIAAAYTLTYWQVPKWLFTGQWLKFLLSLVLLAFVFTVLARLFVIHIAEPIIGYDSYDETFYEIITDPIYLIKVYLPSIYLPGVILFLLKMTKERFSQQNRLVALEKEKQTAELNFLKAQMNPHFLFNTLNNIYALSKNNSDLAPEMILKLSDILDYTIYECKADRVAIKKEWELIEHYADLEALRHHEQISIVLEQNIDDDETLIAPLILISLVENAFKHSLKGGNQAPQIKIALSVLNNKLQFHLANSKAKTISKNVNKKGIGIENVKRQLSLQYPDRHLIIIEDQGDTYVVQLTIQLESTLWPIKQ